MNSSGSCESSFGSAADAPTPRLQLPPSVMDSAGEPSPQPRSPRIPTAPPAPGICTDVAHRPLFGDLTVGTWNSQGLLCCDLARARRKQAYLLSLLRTLDILVTQEAHCAAFSYIELEREVHASQFCFWQPVEDGRAAQRAGWGFWCTDASVGCSTRLRCSRLRSRGGWLPWFFRAPKENCGCTTCTSTTQVPAAGAGASGRCVGLFAFARRSTTSPSVTSTSCSTTATGSTPWTRRRLGVLRARTLHSGDSTSRIGRSCDSPR